MNVEDTAKLAAAERYADALFAEIRTAQHRLSGGYDAYKRGGKKSPRSAYDGWRAEVIAKLHADEAAYRETMRQVKTLRRASHAAAQPAALDEARGYAPTNEDRDLLVEAIDKLYDVDTALSHGVARFASRLYGDAAVLTGAAALLRRKAPAGASAQRVDARPRV